MDDLRNLYELRDRRERYVRVTRGRHALAKGSMDQDVANPLLKQLPGLNREIRSLQDQLGISPNARRRLRIGEAGDPTKPTLEQLLDGLDDEDCADDPRLVVLDGTG